MKTLTDYNQEYIRHIKSNEFTAIADAKKAKDYLKTTGVGSIKGDLCFQLVPKIFNTAAYEVIKNAARMMYGILDKCIREYRENLAFRKLFGFPPLLEDLILAEPGYGCTLPMARIDMFFDEDNFEFKFFEFNADGASAMIEDREIGNALKITQSFKDFEYEIKSFELFDSWIDTLMDIYKEFLGTTFDKKSITVGIVDFLDKATMGEFAAFKNAFFRQRNKLCNCRDYNLRIQSRCVI